MLDLPYRTKMTTGDRDFLAASPTMWKKKKEKKKTTKKKYFTFQPSFVPRFLARLLNNCFEPDLLLLKVLISVLVTVCIYSYKSLFFSSPQHY